MIPKIIHYCWLSRDEFPPLIKTCIDTWKEQLPDYEFILWDTNRFKLESNIWVQQAFDTKKYAFAADYIRLYAIYNFGGIYLDTDIEVLKVLIIYWKDLILQVLKVLASLKQASLVQKKTALGSNNA